MASPASTHTAPDTTAPKTQSTSPTTTRFQRFSPRWSALWAPHHLKPRPHRHQTGGIALHEAPTRRRHAARGLHVVQNPHCCWSEGHWTDHKARPRCRHARKYSPNAAPPTALPRQSSPSKPKNTNFGVFSARWANYFAHRAQRRGDDATAATTAVTDAGHHETAITTARP